METVSKMILSDFQRGRLPYFVPPPKLDDKEATGRSKDSKPIEFVPASNSTESVEAKPEGLIGEKSVRGVRQDLTKINVEPDFMDEDNGLDADGDIEEELDGREDEEDMEEAEDGMEEAEEDLEEAEDDVEESRGEVEEVDEDMDQSENEDDKDKFEMENNDGSNRYLEEANRNLTIGVRVGNPQVGDGVENIKGQSCDLKSKSRMLSKKERRKLKKTEFAQKKIDDEVSFKVSKTTSSETSGDEGLSDSISSIKAKIEAENERSILSSLTPEERQFLGISDEDFEKTDSDDDDDDDDDDANDSEDESDDEDERKENDEDDKKDEDSMNEVDTNSEEDAIGRGEIKAKDSEDDEENIQRSVITSKNSSILCSYQTFSFYSL